MKMIVFGWMVVARQEVHQFGFVFILINGEFIMGIKMLLF